MFNCCFSRAFFDVIYCTRVDFNTAVLLVLASGYLFNLVICSTDYLPHLPIFVSPVLRLSSSIFRLPFLIKSTQAEEANMVSPRHQLTRIMSSPAMRRASAENVEVAEQEVAGLGEGARIPPPTYPPASTFATYYPVAYHPSSSS